MHRCNAELKLLLGIPSAGSPTRPFLDSLAKIELPPTIEHLERAIITGNYVPAQRDLIAERGLELRVDMIVMCDDDMVLPPDAIVQLCAVLDGDPQAGLAGALYYSRDRFRPMAVDQWDEHDTRSAVIPAFDREPVVVDSMPRVTLFTVALASWAGGFRGLKGFTVTGNRVVWPEAFRQGLEVWPSQFAGAGRRPASLAFGKFGGQADDQG